MMEERLRVVAEARKWINTPYQHRGRYLGHGCDCVHILLESFVGAGLVERADLGGYARDWHLHRGDEKYLSGLMSYTHELGEGEQSLEGRGPNTWMPADVLMWKVGRTFSHSALVTEWPYVIHASLPAMRVVEEDISKPGPVYSRPMRVFSFWGNE